MAVKPSGGLTYAQHQAKLNKNDWSTRAKVVYQRTYSRPLEAGGFETWENTIDRVIEHQKWLWLRASGGNRLLRGSKLELQALRELLVSRKAAVSGRTMWLGGTEVAKRREASQFNCSFLRVETVHDIVDAFWLLLQGCGVGFEPVVGTLSGFARPLQYSCFRSTRTDDGKGREGNLETFDDKGNWHISVGDSAEAWAKLPGKLLANKRPCKRLTIDFTEIRPAGIRLKNYGWISSGDELVAKAMEGIVGILNARADELLGRIDTLDIMNWLGTTLSSRRSAEIALFPWGAPGWYEFSSAKANLGDTPWRSQSNNSLVFWQKPEVEDLSNIFNLMVTSGGSEPGFINGQSAQKRAPWFKGVNPCGEILLGNKSFCNLVTVDVSKFNGDLPGLREALRIMSRANYRQTCVNLDDGILQRTWHELNEFLRLQGVSLTGIMQWEHRDDPKVIRSLRDAVGRGSFSMADQLGLPRSKAVTTIKPEGTLSKVMDATSGLHSPPGKYVFNNVNFSTNDPSLDALRSAGYRVGPNPVQADSVLVTLPVAYPHLDLEYTHETALEQLERYKLFMDNYVEHNASITVSYDPSEVPNIVDWVYSNWDSFVGISFLFRQDPTKSAVELGYSYLPQEVVTKETYDAYVSTLKPLALASIKTISDTVDEECVGGSCPIR